MKEKTIEEYSLEVFELKKEAFNLSAELEWYKRFHDIVKQDILTDEKYSMLCKWMYSEDDR